MEITKKTVKIGRTRGGIPCLWESLVTFDDLKRSTVILDKNGKAKTAVYLNEERDKQALVPIVVGDYIAKSFEDKNGIAISVFLIEEISSLGNEAVIVPVYRKSSLVEEETYPAEYATMIETSIQKLKGDIGVVSFKREKEIVA
jgi:hypothetical protein